MWQNISLFSWICWSAFLTKQEGRSISSERAGRLQLNWINGEAQALNSGSSCSFFEPHFLQLILLSCPFIHTPFGLYIFNIYCCIEAIGRHCLLVERINMGLNFIRLWKEWCLEEQNAFYFVFLVPLKKSYFPSSLQHTK